MAVVTVPGSELATSYIKVAEVGPLLVSLGKEDNVFDELDSEAQKDYVLTLGAYSLNTLPIKGLRLNRGVLPPYVDLEKPEQSLAFPRDYTQVVPHEVKQAQALICGTMIAPSISQLYSDAGGASANEQSPKIQSIALGPIQVRFDNGMDLSTAVPSRETLLVNSTIMMLLSNHLIHLRGRSVKSHEERMASALADRVEPTYVITASTTGAGTITPEGSVVVTHRADQTFSFDAGAVSLTVDGVLLPVPDSNSHTFTLVREEHTILVEY